MERMSSMGHPNDTRGGIAPDSSRQPSTAEGEIVDSSARRRSVLRSLGVLAVVPTVLLMV